MFRLYRLVALLIVCMFGGSIDFAFAQAVTEAPVECRADRPVRTITLRRMGSATIDFTYTSIKRAIQVGRKVCNSTISIKSMNTSLEILGDIDRRSSRRLRTKAVIEYCCN